MTSFEDKILASVKIRAEGINASSFISNLRAKQVYESNRKKELDPLFCICVHISDFNYYI